MEQQKHKNTTDKICVDLFSAISIGILLTALIFDLVPFEYFNIAIQDFFTYDPSNALSVLTIVWGFTTAYLLFYMERSSERTLGIRLSEILKYRSGKHKLNSTYFLCFLELLLLVLASMYRLMITITVSVFIEFLTMCNVFLMVQSITSVEKVSRYIKDQMRTTYKEWGEKPDAFFPNYNNLLIVHVICNINRNSEDEMDQILEILTSKDFLGSTKQIRPRIIWRNYQRLTEYVLSSGEISEKKELLLKNLMAYDNFAVKRGVTAAFVRQCSAEHTKWFPLLKSLLQTSGTEDTNIWCVKYYQYLSKKNGERWRNAFVQEIKKEISLDWESPSVNKRMKQCEREIGADHKYFK